MLLITFKPPKPQNHLFQLCLKVPKSRQLNTIKETSIIDQKLVIYEFRSKDNIKKTKPTKSKPTK